MLGDMGVAGVDVCGDVVVDELRAGEIDCGGCSSNAVLCDTVTKVVLGIPIAAGSVGWPAAAARFSIAEFRRIIILLVLGKSKLLFPTNSFP